MQRKGITGKALGVAMRGSGRKSMALELARTRKIKTQRPLMRWWRGISGLVADHTQEP